MNGPAASELNSAELYALARDKSPTARAALVEAITGLPLEEEHAMSDRERGLLFDILGQIVHDAEMSVRRTISACLSDLPDAPRDLIRLLANDSIEIAYPVLSKNGVLQDSDLIEIILNRSIEHQLAITVRKNLSEAVSDSLVATGDEKVIRSLLRNTDASISRTTMEYLVEQSKRYDSFQEPILRRRDLDPELVTRMFSWVSSALRQLIIDDWDLDPAVIDDLLERATAREIQATAYEAAEKLKSEQLADKLLENQQITPEMMVKTLQEGEVALFINMFQKFTNTDVNFAKRILFEPQGERLTIVCKAAGIGKAIFTAIFAMTRKARMADDAATRERMKQCLKTFDSISRSEAVETVRRWQLNVRSVVWTDN